MLRYLPVPFWLRFEVSQLRLVVVRLYCSDGVAGRVIAELFNGNGIVEAEDEEEQYEKRNSPECASTKVGLAVLMQTWW